jgi:hypothetical protein
MDWTQPVSIDIPQQERTLKRRAILFFGHYDCRVYLTPTAYLDVGAGSLTCALSVTQLAEGHVGSLGSIGRYCEFATCEIQSAGEHNNALPVNIGMSQSPLFAQVIRQAGVKALTGHQPISIGSGVVLSAGVKVLAGTPIGDGAVVGAGAIVTKPVEPFSIVGGVPARAIRDRFDAETKQKVAAGRWWDRPATEILSHAARLQTLALEPQAAPRPERPRFVFHAETPESFKFVGIAQGEEIVRLTVAPPAVQRYVEQAYGDGPYYWLADCWA